MRQAQDTVEAMAHLLRAPEPLNDWILRALMYQAADVIAVCHAHALLQSRSFACLRVCLLGRIKLALLPSLILQVRLLDPLPCWLRLPPRLAQSAPSDVRTTN